MKYILPFFLFLTGCFSGFHRDCPGTLGVSWVSLPAKISPLNLTSGELQVLEDAVQKWNGALGSEYLRIEGGSVNTIRNGGIQFQENKLAVTTITSFYPFINYADIYVRTDLGRNVDLELIYIHELGHFLGLDHTEGTVMNPTHPDFVYKIEIEPVIVDQIKCLYEGR